MPGAADDPMFVTAASIERSGATWTFDTPDVDRVLRANRHRMPGLHRSLVFLRARYKYPDAPADVVRALAAAAMGLKEDALLAGPGLSTRPPLRAVSVERDGQRWSFEPDELEALDSQLVQGTWLVAHLYPQAKARCGRVDVAIALVSGLLGQTEDEVRQALDWHVEYMRWHDGDSGYDIY